MAQPLRNQGDHALEWFGRRPTLTPQFLPFAAMHYDYLLHSTSHPHRRYVGYTQDLRQRIADHNSGRNTSTRPYRLWSLRTYLAFSTKLQALGFESYLKSGSGHAFARKRLW